MKTEIKTTVIFPEYHLPVFVIFIHSKNYSPFAIYEDSDINNIDNIFLNYGFNGCTIMRIKDGKLFNNLESFYIDEKNKEILNIPLSNLIFKVDVKC